MRKCADQLGRCPAGQQPAVPVEVGLVEVAAGFNVNLWMGIAMLVFTAFFAIWALVRPVVPDEAK
jgi:hypothetical protein